MEEKEEEHIGRRERGGGTVMRDSRGEGRRCQVSHLHMYGRGREEVGEEDAEVD